MVVAEKRADSFQKSKRNLAIPSEKIVLYRI
jgi:hypothetical protein